LYQLAVLALKNEQSKCEQGPREITGVEALKEAIRRRQNQNIH